MQDFDSLIYLRQHKAAACADSLEVFSSQHQRREHTSAVRNKVRQERVLVRTSTPLTGVCFMSQTVGNSAAGTSRATESLYRGYGPQKHRQTPAAGSTTDIFITLI